MYVSDPPVLRRYLVNRRCETTEETIALFWDSRLPGTQDEPLDDGELRIKLASMVRQTSPYWQLPARQLNERCCKSSMWKTDSIKLSTGPRIILV